MKDIKLKNICDICGKKNKCFFKKNNFVCKKLVELIKGGKDD